MFFFIYVKILFVLKFLDNLVYKYLPILFFLTNKYM